MQVLLDSSDSWRRPTSTTNTSNNNSNSNSNSNSKLDDASALTSTSTRANESSSSSNNNNNNNNNRTELLFTELRRVIDHTLSGASSPTGLNKLLDWYDEFELYRPEREPLRKMPPKKSGRAMLREEGMSSSTVPVPMAGGSSVDGAY
jgi:hypothetical protein